MKVSLIDHTGIGLDDNGHYAAALLVYTKSTRLEQGEATKQSIFSKSLEELAPELDYISKTLRSSWEFVDYTFQINGVTRAFTHQLVRTRTGSYAQQAQRVVDMSSFGYEVPVTCLEDEPLAVFSDCMHDIARSYAKLKSLGVPAQDCRGVLPTNVHTNIIAKFNLRTMADLCAKRDNARAQGEYIDVMRAMKKLVLEVHPWAKPFLEPDRLKTPALDKLLMEMLGKKGPLDLPEVNAALKEVDTLKATWG